MKISVLNVTKRHGGIDILHNNLRKQTEKDLELIIVDELYDERHKEVADYVSVPLKHIKPRPKGEGDVWNLAKAYNDGLRVAEGELVVVVDDFIWMQPGAISRFWEAYMEKGKALFTGVGHKAPYPPVTNPKGKITIFSEDYRSRPAGIVEQDTRIDGRTHLEEVNHSFFELAYSAFPLSVAKEIGGFDEDTDKFYCGQDRNFALRCHLRGYSVYMDRGNENIGLFHQGFNPRPDDWEERHYNKNPRPTLDILEDVRPVVQSWI